jgi:protein-tyrosine phosphatase
MAARKISVLFVCMGNICRSPTAEGVFRERVKTAGLDFEIEIDSAGTHAYHIGEPPDHRSQSAALKRGIDLSALRARQVEVADFHRFNYILAMDAENLRLLSGMRPADGKAEVRLLLDYSPISAHQHVPDPYYGGGDGFEHVLDLLEAASAEFIEHLRDRH